VNDRHYFPIDDQRSLPIQVFWLFVISDLISKTPDFICKRSAISDTIRPHLVPDKFNNLVFSIGDPIMALSSYLRPEKRKRLLGGFGALVFVVLVSLGVMANKGWLPSTDPISGKKTGWFGKELPKNASSSWNPLAAPLPTPTLQLSKELIYAGQRLLAVEDANANAAPSADIAVWRPSTGVWYVLDAQQTTATWGTSSTDQPVPGDYDGDGKTDFSVFRESTGEWFIQNSGGGSPTTLTWGASGDTPAPADYDGDGRTDAAVYRPSSGTWYIFQSSTESMTQYTWGVGTDTPVCADYDGDGRADIAVWRPSTGEWSILQSSNGAYVQSTWGASGDTPVPADYDGDGKADTAVFRPTNGNWYINRSTAGSITYTWGQSGDKVVHNDYDADGKVDIGTWRPSTGQWNILKSSDSNLKQHTWGQNGDIPVPAFYRR